MSSQIDNSVSYFLLGNIPRGFRSYNLRAYFSHLVEKEAFVCFHFRHRPEFLNNSGGPATPSGNEKTTPTASKHKDVNTEQKTMSRTENETVDDTSFIDYTKTTTRSSETAQNFNADAAVQANTHCCPLSVKSEHVKELLSYNGKHWTDGNDDIMRERVRIQALKLRSEESTSEGSHKQNNSLSSDQILSLVEFSPPSSMPQGNIGTSLKVFQNLIRTCRLPPSVIKKLRLVFPSHSKRYGAVPLDYGIAKKGKSLSDFRKDELKQPAGRKKRKLEEEEDRVELEEEDEEIEQENENDDFGAEDWERYEALHDDVDKQDRTSERLFEDEMEVTWDKGSSGLVFYTDASYWHQQEGDFDEQCSQEDDWDVDMSLYYGYESADKPARDMRDMEIEKRLRAGEDLQDIVKKKPTESFGRKIMKEKGWKEGTGLGPSSLGISEPVEAEGQSSHCKTGLGYRGEKLTLKPQARKKTREVLIPTIYDEKDEEKDTVMKRGPPTVLKYRDKSFPSR
ncbi:PREDICTED: G patch domain-containing protein 3-like [Amphimedon queenslandica]|uniref:G-patch domain-containing protein n=1 Tax=Amphimedon queenslandica TaxID=400682 RepID=A0AAN0INZ3_AMPQE|nr:PREDICTED: G patch domain-containing protein 3-like [Amphimedon queenslandica]|eukprot:XP_011405377.1 PREDICTED: G patch domain-containing protein 3-like [Amphimedon queenslandica]